MLSSRKPTRTVRLSGTTAILGLSLALLGVGTSAQAEPVPGPDSAGPGISGNGTSGTGTSGTTASGTGASGNRAADKAGSPQPPQLSTPVAGKDGLVTFSVRGDAGSQIIVKDEKNKIVARLTGTGKRQQVRLHSRTGEHRYRAIATDSAGRKSAAAKVEATADASPPEVRDLRVRSASPTDIASVFRFSTEAGAKYVLNVDGRQHLRGTTTSEQELEVWLPDGRHRMALTVTDPAGNTRRVTWRTTVAVKTPEVDVKVLSAPGAVPVLLEITAPNRSTGSVALPGQAGTAFKIGAVGRTTVSLDLPDGSYPPGTVTVRDAVGRTGTTRTPAVEVDTAAPRLDVTVDDDRTGTGHLALAVRAEPGTQVSVRAVRKNRTAAEQVIVAGTDVHPLDYALTAGEYQVEVVATDAAGNVTTWTEPVAVSVPLSLLDWILVVSFLGVLALGAVLMWRQRARIGARRRRRRAASADRKRELEAAQAQAAADRARAESNRRNWTYETQDAVWNRRHAYLAELLELARSATGTPADVLPAGVEPLAEERVLISRPGVLVEERAQDKRTSVVPAGPGTVTVTSRRILFSGDEQREWSFESYLSHSHLGPDTTLLTVRDRPARSGVICTTDAEQARLLIDIAVSEATGGSRTAAVERVRQALARHDAVRPVRPAGVEEPIHPAGADEPEPQHQPVG